MCAVGFCLVGDDFAITPLQLRIFHGHGRIDGDGMTLGVGGIVSQRSQGEGVFVDVLGSWRRRFTMKSPERT